MMDRKEQCEVIGQLCLDRQEARQRVVLLEYSLGRHADQAKQLAWYAEGEIEKIDVTKLQDIPDDLVQQIHVDKEELVRARETFDKLDSEFKKFC